MVLWRAVGVLALALTAMAVFWHRVESPPPVERVIPPYTTPAVAHELLATSDLPSAGRSFWLPMQDGPPDSALFTGTGRLRADLRQMTVTGAWQRSWESADAKDTVLVRALEMRQAAYARIQSKQSCSPSTPLRLAGADRAGFLQRGADYSFACAVLLRGRTAVVVLAQSSRAKAPQVTEKLVTDVIRLQGPRVEALPDLSAATWRDSTTRTALNAEAMSAAVGVPLALGLLAVLRDPASWRRLRSFLSRPRPDGVFRVDRLVNVRLAASTAAVLVRFCVYAWAVRLAEMLSLGVWATVAVAVTAVAGILLVEWLLRRRLPARWRPGVFQGRGRFLAVLGSGFTGMIAGAGVLLVVVGSDMQAMGTSPAGTSDFVATGFGTVTRVAGVGLVLFALVPFIFVRRLGMRYLRQQVERDQRPPTLMLRSFADDRRTLRARRLDRASVVERLCMRRFERFEEIAASALSVHGPVVALSQVGEKLPPPLGAVRRSFSMDDWKDRVRELIVQSQLICVTVGRSESLLWEIRQIRAAGALERTVFLLPPTRRGEQRLRLAVLGYALGIDWSVLDRARPGTEVLAITLPFGSPVIIAGRAPNDVSYEAAIEIAALAVSGAEHTAVTDVRQLVGAYVEYAQGAGEGTGRPGIRGARQAPPVRIHAPGKAPVYRPWWRRWWLLPWVVSGGIAAVFTLLFGHSLDDSDTVSYRSPVTSVVQDEVSDTDYAVLGGRSLVRLDFEQHTGRPVARVDDYVNELVVRGTSAYYISVQSGRVGRVDLRSGRTMWTRSAGAGVRALALVGDRVVVASPDAGRVDALAVKDGRRLARRSVTGAPYGVTQADGRLFVSLAQRDEVLELAPADLRPVAQLNVPRGPLQLATRGKQVWVRSALDHVLQAVGPRAGGTEGSRLLLSDQTALVSGNGEWLAVQGMERVTVVRPDGTLNRVPLPDASFLSLLVQRDGAVVVSYASGEITRIN
ncbi:YncE family protein [Streptomyces sp. STR69]|uniref:YncE family protein n=1 Tax=Streptomyces sp. STR69 TaxID=1796942 RepID=UPI0021C87786|nr:PQQ-binding-like beta-propeller repeat protein [Streptomyces sp. STR69]